MKNKKHPVNFVPLTKPGWCICDCGFPCRPHNLESNHQTHTHHPPTPLLSLSWLRFSVLSIPRQVPGFKGTLSWETLKLLVLINSKIDFHKYNNVSHSRIPLIFSASWLALCFPVYFCVALHIPLSIKSYPSMDALFLSVGFILSVFLKHLDAWVKWEIRMCIPGVWGWKDATVNIRPGHLCRAHRRLDAAESMSGKE